MEEFRLTERDAVLFDLDGTLLFLPVDVERVRAELRAYFLQLGVDMVFRPLLAQLDRAVQAVQEVRGPAQARAAARWAGAVVARAEVRAAAEATPRPGAVRALLALAARGVWVGVVSNNTRAGVEAALAAIGIGRLDVDALVSREDVPEPKPAPDGILLAVEELRARGWSPEGEPAPRVVFVGDAPADAQAARAAAPRLRAQGVEMVCVGVMGGRVPLEPGAAPPFRHLVPDDAVLERLLVGEVVKV